MEVTVFPFIVPDPALSCHFHLFAAVLQRRIGAREVPGRNDMNLADRPPRRSRLMEEPMYNRHAETNIK